jgi:hypothetical protein
MTGDELVRLCPAMARDIAAALMRWLSDGRRLNESCLSRPGRPIKNDDPGSGFAGLILPNRFDMWVVSYSFVFRNQDRTQGDSGSNDDSIRRITMWVAWQFD